MLAFRRTLAGCVGKNGKKNYTDFFRSEDIFYSNYTSLKKHVQYFPVVEQPDVQTCLYSHTGSTTKISHVQKMEFYNNCFMILNCKLSM